MNKIEEKISALRIINSSSLDKAIVGFDRYGVAIDVYLSLTEASRKLNVNYKYILKSLDSDIIVSDRYYFRRVADIKPYEIIRGEVMKALMVCDALEELDFLELLSVIEEKKRIKQLIVKDNYTNLDNV